MIKKIIFRFLACCFVLVLLAACGLGVAIYMAVSAPAGYASVIDIPDGDAMTRRFDIKLIKLITSGLSEQERIAFSRERFVSERLTQQEWNQLLNEFDRNEVSESQSIHQNELNAWLASEIPDKPGDGLHDPRLLLHESTMELVAQLRIDDVSLYISAELRPIASAKQLQFEIIALRVGRIPLPVDWIADLLAEEIAGSGENVTLDATASPPRLSINWDEANSGRIRIREIELADQSAKITVEKLVIQ